MTGNRLEFGTRNGPRDVVTSEGLADTYLGGIDMSKPSKKSRREYMKAWRAANAERLREYQREYDRTRRDPEKHRAKSRRYRQENLEASRSREREYAKANREKKREYGRNWRQANKDKVTEAARAYHAENRKARAEYFQRWYAENSEIAKANARRRVVRKAGATGSHTEAEWQMVLDVYDGRCAYCNKPADGRDHIIPLSKGGRDDIDNIVPACQACNSSKRARYLWDWANRPSQATRR